MSKDYCFYIALYCICIPVTEFVQQIQSYTVRTDVFVPFSYTIFIMVSFIYNIFLMVFYYIKANKKVLEMKGY